MFTHLLFSLGLIFEASDNIDTEIVFKEFHSIVISVSILSDASKIRPRGKK